MIKFVQGLPFREALVKRTCLMCHFSFSPGVYSSVLAQEGTRDIPNLEITPRERSPRGAAVPRTFFRARSRGVLNKEQGQMPLLAVTMTPVSRYFELFGSRSIEPSDRHRHLTMYPCC